MAVLKDQIFQGREIVIDDGTEFDNCQFAGCTLVVTGEDSVGMKNCWLTETCEPVFDGAAARTVETIRFLMRALGDEMRHRILRLLTVEATESE